MPCCAHVIAAVDAQTSISAKVRHRVDLLGQPLIGSGIYLQQGRGAERVLRLELNLQTGEQASQLQQVCDGNESVDFRGSRSMATRAEPGRRGAVAPCAAQDRRRAAATPGWRSADCPSCWPASKARFTLARWPKAAWTTCRVWTIEGTWKPARLVQLLPRSERRDRSGQPADLSKLAPNLPDRVVLHVGCDDLFPYRIEYWRAVPRRAKTPKPKIAAQLLAGHGIVRSAARREHRSAGVRVQPGELQAASIARKSSSTSSALEDAVARRGQSESAAAPLSVDRG